MVRAIRAKETAARDIQVPVWYMSSRVDVVFAGLLPWLLLKINTSYILVRPLLSNMLKEKSEWEDDQMERNIDPWQINTFFHSFTAHALPCLLSFVAYPLYWRQRAFRGSRGRMYASRRALKNVGMEALKCVLHEATAKIQRVYRGHLGRVEASEVKWT